MSAVREMLRHRYGWNDDPSMKAAIRKADREALRTVGAPFRLIGRAVGTGLRHVGQGFRDVMKPPRARDISEPTIEEARMIRFAPLGADDGVSEPIYGADDYADEDYGADEDLALLVAKKFEQEARGYVDNLRTAYASWNFVVQPPDPEVSFDLRGIKNVQEAIRRLDVIASHMPVRVFRAADVAANLGHLSYVFSPGFGDPPAGMLEVQHVPPVLPRYMPEVIATSVTLVDDDEPWSFGYDGYGRGR